MVVTSELLEELFVKIQGRKDNEPNYKVNPEIYNDVYESKLTIDIISHQRVIIFTKTINNQKTKVRLEYKYISHCNESGHYVWSALNQSG